MVVADTSKLGKTMTNFHSALYACYVCMPLLSCILLQGYITHCSTCKVDNQLSSSHMSDSYQSSPSRHYLILLSALPKRVWLHTNFTCDIISREHFEISVVLLIL